MIYTLQIDGRLPSLNEYISANRSNPFNGAKFKKREQATIEDAILSQFKGLSINSKVKIHYKWFEPNDRRDLDNVCGFGHKVIQDALVSCGVLENDKWGNIVGFTDEFYLDKTNPRIVVQIEEV